MRANTAYAVIFFTIFIIHENLALANTVAQSFGVTATVGPTCTMSPISTLAFGTYVFSNPTPLPATTVISYECTAGVSGTANIGLNAGLAPGATTTTRQMQSGSNLLNYNLYQDSAHTLNWGNNQGVDTVPIVADGNVHTATVYGTIPVNQPVASGSYTDTITATLTY